MKRSKNYKFPEGVIAIPRQAIRSDAYKNLRPPARALMVAIQDIWRPNESGLHYSVRRASENLGVSIATTSKAFNDLIEHGFIKCTEESNWLNGKAREWHLNWLAYNGHEPTAEYLHWEK